MSRPDTVVVFKGKNGWWWHRLAGNRKVIASSAEAYVERNKAVTMAKRCNPGIVIDIRETT